MMMIRLRFSGYWRYIFLLICISTASNAVADNVSERMYQREMYLIDSLKRDIDTQGITESQRLYNYLQIAISYHGSVQDSAIFYAKKGITLAMKTKDNKRLREFYGILGMTQFFKANYEESYAALERARELAVAQGNKEEEMNLVALMGTAYAKAGKYNTSIDYFLQALKMAEEGGFIERSVMALANLSEINRRLGNTETALSYLKQAEEKSGHLEESRYRWRIFHIFNEYAFNYLDSGDTDRALHYALKADSIGEIVAGSINICYTKGLLATISLKQNDYDRALQYANESYREASMVNDKNLYAYAGKILSDVYMAQKNYPEAEAAALRVWESDSTHIDESRGIVENIVRANIRMGNREKADYYLKKYSELNAAYSKRSFQTIVSDLSIKYETEKKEMLIASLQQQRILYVSMGIAGMLLALALLIFFRQRLRQEQQEKQLIASNAVLKWEKEERRQFASNIHDGISGMLSAIKIELSAVEHLQEIRNRLDNCIETVRRIARGMMPVSLERYGLKASLEDYCRLFSNVRFYFFGKDRRMDEKTELTVYYCAYELVNNAFKHADAAHISVQLIQDDNRVSLTIQDDGCGFDTKSLVQGAGMRNVNDRVAAIDGKVEIVSSPGNGTEVTIELKIKN